MVEGGGGGQAPGEGGDNNDDKTSTSSCSETATATTTTACDTACSEATDSACATICDTITVAPCTTTPAGAFQIVGDGDGDNFDWINESDDELNAEGSIFASYINPYLTNMDPIMIGSMTFTASGPLPTAPPTATSTKATSTTTKQTSDTWTQTGGARPYPTQGTGDGRPYCFRDHLNVSKDSTYESFDMDEYKDAKTGLCEGWKTMAPSDGGHTYISPKQLIAWAYYAINQTDCAPKSEFDFTQPCETWIADLFQLCDIPMEFKEFYGGGFVQTGPEGCIEYYIGKPVAV